MLLTIFGLTLAALAYSVLTNLELKGDLMSFQTDMTAKLADQSTKIDAAAARVLAALANVVDPAAQASMLAAVDANNVKIDAFAAPAPAPAPAP